MIAPLPISKNHIPIAVLTSMPCIKKKYVLGNKRKYNVATWMCDECKAKTKDLMKSVQELKKLS